jgi:hypothetical protein
MPDSQGRPPPHASNLEPPRSWRSREETQTLTTERPTWKVVNRPMAETENRAVQQQKTEPGSVAKRPRYSESYRHLYALRQDVLNKTRQLEWSLDQIVLYVRDLLR